MKNGNDMNRVLKIVTKTMLGIFVAFCLMQNLVNIIGAMYGFGIPMDGSLRFWMVLSGGVITTAISLGALLGVINLIKDENK